MKKFFAIVAAICWTLAPFTLVTQLCFAHCEVSYAVDIALLNLGAVAASWLIVLQLFELRE